MLELSDRLQVAMLNGLGIQLSKKEVVDLAGVLVTYRQSDKIGVFNFLKKLFGE